ncbi:hypothetical protein ACINK0_11625 [Deinococcus sp. VB343]|uniref:Uncharacterized protein n=1 Tax=Deinococcus sp. VB142 TaxID=3112952 RepID=A0AAU6Q3W8_9DEIO
MSTVSDLLVFAALFLSPPLLYVPSLGLWRRLSLAARRRLGYALHVFACV